jgi:hypothetical protein
MVVVSLLVLTTGAGGYAGDKTFGFAGILVLFAMFWGLPLLALMSLFHFLDKRFGPYVRYPIAMIGLSPLLFVIYFRGQGDHIFMMAIVVSGFAWAAAWLVTSRIFVSDALQPV